MLRERATKVEKLDFGELLALNIVHGDVTEIAVEQVEFPDA